jgi:hypothetical protein
MMSKCDDGKKGRMSNMKRCGVFCLALLLAGCYCLSLAVEPGNCRLLSISSSEKLILVSQIPSKTKYLLDAASAKITVDGKPAEFKELKVFSIIQVKMELRKSTRNGVTIDGSAVEIQISNPDKAQ